MKPPAVARPHGTAAERPGVVPAASVGEGVLDTLDGGFAGRVESVFDGGFYVVEAEQADERTLPTRARPWPERPVSAANKSGRHPLSTPLGLTRPRGPVSPSQTIFAVLGPQSWAGPLHLVAAEMLELPDRDDAVTVSDGVLNAGRTRIRVDPAQRWEPRLPDRLNAGAAAWRGMADPADPHLAPVWEAVAAHVRLGDLAAASRQLQGRGAGLTPSGDDVLAGILLVCAMDRARRGALGRLARSARTTALSRAYLRWAAAGQSIQPAHALLDAAADNDTNAMGWAAQTLAAVGATSGRALVAGIALAATGLPATSTNS
jgi:hypothetical protein